MSGMPTWASNHAQMLRRRKLGQLRPHLRFRDGMWWCCTLSRWTTGKTWAEALERWYQR